jgi:exosortase A
MSSRRGWGMAAIIASLAIGVFLLYWPTAASLMEEWGDTGNLTYTHGYLIAALSLWLIARKREPLATASIVPSALAAGALFFASVIWLVAFRAGIQIIDQLLVPVLIWLTVCATMGSAVAKPVTFPIFYLVFAIPVWDYVNFLLQRATVVAVDLMLKVTGITAFVEDNMVHIPAGVFEIAGGCSGLHFFIVGLAIAALYGETGGDGLKARLQILAVGLGLSLFSNWLRVYIIVLAGDLTNMQHYLVRVEHYRFGWFMFALVMIAFFAIVRRIPAPVPRPVSAAAPVAVDPAKRWGSIALAGAALGLVPLWTLSAPQATAALPVSLLPQQVPGWSGPQSAVIAWNPVFNGLDKSERAAYVSPKGERVEIYVAAYRSQTQQKELVGYGNSLLGPGEGELVTQTHIGVPHPMIEAVAQAGRDQSVIHYYYEIGGSRTHREIAAQLSYGLRSLAGAPLSKIVAIRAACVPDCAAARTLLGRFDAGAEPSQ